MFVRNLIFRKPFIQNLFEIYKISGINKVKAGSNISISNITYGSNQKPKCIVWSQCYGISKRYLSSNCVKSELRKDDEFQPQLKEVPLEEGDFYLSETHFDRKIQYKDIGRRFTVGEDVITALNNIYGIERRLALSMMRSKKFLLVADSNILQTIYFLGKCNISPEQVQRIPWLLMYDCEILQRRLDIVVRPNLFKSIEDGLGFCYLPESRINELKVFFSREAKNFPNHQNRLYCMADLLDVPIAHLIENIVKPHHVISMDFKRITYIIDILKQFNVSKDDILRDLWIFQRNIGKTEERLRTITEAGCTRPRLWMCRSTDHIWKRTLKIYKDEKLLLQDGRITVIEYLAEQLKCTPELFKKHPHLLRIRVSKLQSMIEMLLSEGITRDALKETPRILQHSEKKIRNRIHCLKSLGYQPTFCSILVQDKFVFKRFCQKIKSQKGPAN